MNTDTLPLFAGRSAFSHLPLNCHLPDAPGVDFLGEMQARILAAGPDCDADEFDLAEIAKWRARQAAGDLSPRSDCWGEYLVRLDDGTPITAIVQSPWIGPGRGSLVDFHGDMTATGYLSHFFSAGDVPETDFGEWLRAIAQSARNETLAAFMAAKMPRRTRARKQSRNRTEEAS